MSDSPQTPYRIFHPAAMRSHERGGGARTTPLVLPSMGDTSFINGITEFAAGANIAFHSHNCSESVMVLSGHACLDIEGESHELKQFDTTFIPANIPHRFRNLSATEPMKILWIYARPDATRTIVATGETHAISAEHG